MVLSNTGSVFLTLFYELIISSYPVSVNDYNWFPFNWFPILDLMFLRLISFLYLLKCSKLDMTAYVVAHLPESRIFKPFYDFLRGIEPYISGLGQRHKWVAEKALTSGK